MRRAPLLLALLVLAPAVPRASLAALCAADRVPAATLLFPFFELDLDDPQSRDTELSIENVGESPVIAHVTLWSDWAIPVLDFDVYLAPYDVQTLDLEDVLVGGLLPVTGSAVSPHGPLSGPPQAFPGCNASITPGAPPVYPTPALSVPLRLHVQAALTGAPSALTGKCYGANRGNRVARGYVTVDANDQCTILFPSDVGYFAPAGATTRRNVLLGDFSLRQTTDGYAFSFPAVAIEAAAEGDAVPGGRTFYGRYVGGSGADGREPLPTVHEARALAAAAFSAGTTIMVWRETVGGMPAAVNCGTSPPWAPLSTEMVAYFDEQEDVADVSQGFGTAVEIQDTANPFYFGRAVLDLQHAGVTPLYGGPQAQAWVAWAARGPLFALSATAAHHPVSCTP